ncbi:formimidoylglutamase [Cognatitamlana onchidii]|uniref:formimidoylglutamase n=1 Tax=Cognatitamlana onchidii TaxID=2562860 RepID=UPI002938FC4A|nr:formimidoylglutamase [Algibacter onchidii]
MLTNISSIYEQLKSLDVTHVVLGLSEDVGVFANSGKTGTSRAWETTLKALLNIQSNKFTKATSVLILGHIDFSHELLAISKLNPKKKQDIAKSRKLVDKIDRYVTHIIYQIVSAGKKPIIIGGGHNNGYGAIKGTCLALDKPINVVNFDAHSDFRIEEGRHSGNAFKYAFTEGFLRNYFIFGLHENYTSNKVLDLLDKTKSVEYNTYEAIEVRNDLKFKKELQRAARFVSDDVFGIEIDCDAILNTPSSATTPSGFGVNKARLFVSFMAKLDNAKYLHICEGIPSKKKPHVMGKLITYLITDFIKSN